MFPMRPSIALRRILLTIIPRLDAKRDYNATQVEAVRDPPLPLISIGVCGLTHRSAGTHQVPPHPTNNTRVPPIGALGPAGPTNGMCVPPIGVRGPTDSRKQLSGPTIALNDRRGPPIVIRPCRSHRPCNVGAGTAGTHEIPTNKPGPTHGSGDTHLG